MPSQGYSSPSPYQGPVRPGTSESTFRTTGKSISETPPGPKAGFTGGGSSGGGSSSSGGGGTSTPIRSYFTPNPLLNPQAISQASQQQSQLLQRENVNAQREANQRDTNALVKTQYTSPIGPVQPTAMNQNITSLPSSISQNITMQEPLGFWGKANEAVAKYTTKPVYNALTKIGLDPTSSSLQAKSAPALFGIGPFGYKPEEYKQIYGGFLSGVNLEIRDKPLKVGGLIAASFVGGLAFEGLSIGASAISPALSTGVKLTGYGLGAVSTGAYTYGVGKQVYFEPNLTTKSQIVGRELVDISAIGLGFGRGMKATQQIQGYVSTYSRKEIPFEKLTQK